MRVFMVVLLLALTACGAQHNYSPPASPPPQGSLGGGGGEGEGNPDEVSFASATAAFKRNRCLTCHSTKNHAAGIDLEQYETAKGFGPSIRGAVDDGSMPLGGPPVSAADAAIIDAWVVAGTPP